MRDLHDYMIEWLNHLIKPTNLCVTDQLLCVLSVYECNQSNYHHVMYAVCCMHHRSFEIVWKIEISTNRNIHNSSLCEKEKTKKKRKKIIVSPCQSLNPCQHSIQRRHDFQLAHVILSINIKSIGKSICSHASQCASICMVVMSHCSLHSLRSVPNLLGLLYAIIEHRTYFCL